jgi:hypothetical protein
VALEIVFDMSSLGDLSLSNFLIELNSDVRTPTIVNRIPISTITPRIAFFNRA